MKLIKNLIITLLAMSTVCFGGDIMAEHVVTGIFLDVSNTVQKEFNKIIKLEDICFESKTTYLGKTLYNYSIISLPRIELSILVDDYSNRVIDYYLRYKNTSGYEDVRIPITMEEYETFVNNLAKNFQYFIPVETAPWCIQVPKQTFTLIVRNDEKSDISEKDSEKEEIKEEDEESKEIVQNEKIEEKEADKSSENIANSATKLVSTSTSSSYSGSAGSFSFLKLLGSVLTTDKVTVNGQTLQFDTIQDNGELDKGGWTEGNTNISSFSCDAFWVHQTENNKDENGRISIRNITKNSTEANLKYLSNLGTIIVASGTLNDGTFYKGGQLYIAQVSSVDITVTNDFILGESGYWEESSRFGHPDYDFTGALRLETYSKNLTLSGNITLVDNTEILNDTLDSKTSPFVYLTGNITGNYDLTFSSYNKYGNNTNLQLSGNNDVKGLNIDERLNCYNNGTTTVQNVNGNLINNGNVNFVKDSTLNGSITGNGSVNSKGNLVVKSGSTVENLSLSTGSTVKLESNVSVLKNVSFNGSQEAYMSFGESTKQNILLTNTESVSSILGENKLINQLAIDAREGFVEVRDLVIGEEHLFVNGNYKYDNVSVHLKSDVISVTDFKGELTTCGSGGTDIYVSDKILTVTYNGISGSTLTGSLNFIFEYDTSLYDGLKIIFDDSIKLAFDDLIITANSSIGKYNSKENAVYFDLMPVPEPSCGLLVFLGSFLLFKRRRQIK